MKIEMEDIDDYTICDSVSSLVEGCRLPVHMSGTDDWRKYGNILIVLS